MSEAVSVFEVFEGDPEDIKERKLQTQSIFEKDVYELHSNNFESACKLLREIRDEQNPDSCLEIYYRRCEQLLDLRSKKKGKSDYHKKA